MGRLIVVFDTNILIDCANGIPAAIAEVKRRTGAIISIVTWVEVMAGARTDAEADRLRQFLMRFHRVDLYAEVAEEAAILRRQYRLKLPDAAILATARLHQATLITRDTKDFFGISGVLAPYSL